MSGIKIFVIEDNLGDLILIKEMLKDSGLEFEVESSQTLEDGLKSFKEKQYDMLLLDLGLPDSNGIETFIKAHEEIPHQPIIILTGLADEEQGTISVSKGAQDYLIKGQIDGKLLSKSIRYALERKKIEIMFLEEQEKARTYFDSAGTMMVVLDTNKKIIEINKKGCETLGYLKEELMGKNWFELVVPDEDKDGRAKIFEEMITGTRKPHRQKEKTIIRKNGDRIIISWTNTLIKDDTDHVTGILRSGEDVTKTIEYENEIKTSLEEKELLLREIHHRVKNNLQIISSLLNLQSEQIRDKEVLDHFNDCQNRVKSISLVHEKLYQSEDIAQISLPSYIQHLGNDLIKNYGNDNINLNLDIADIAVDIDTAIPCGLIINELISNSLKHAFPENKSGEIKIILKESESKPSQFELIISDNGVGIPPEIDIDKLETLGLQLVYSLVRQLDGQIKLVEGPGTKFHITFHAAEYEKRV